VAYLRLSAHTEVKPEPTSLNLQPRAILEDQFQSTYDSVIKIPRIHSVVEPFDQSQIAMETNPSIVQIGDGVFATGTLSPPASYSVEQGIRYCFDTLTSTPSPLQSKLSPPPSTPPLPSQHNHNHSSSAGHVRLHSHQPPLLDLLSPPPSPLPHHNLNPTPLKSQSLRHNKHPPTNRPPRPIPQLLGPRQYRSLLSINFCIPPLPFSPLSKIT
jgi:hypothetical protein